MSRLPAHWAAALREGGSVLVDGIAYTSEEKLLPLVPKEEKPYQPTNLPVKDEVKAVAKQLETANRKLGEANAEIERLKAENERLRKPKEDDPYVIEGVKESALKALKDAGFGSVEAIRKADDKALLAVEGIDAKVLGVLREKTKE